MVFQQNLIEKAYFIAKMSGPTMVRPASSDFWKTPLYNYTVLAVLQSVHGIAHTLALKVMTFWVFFFKTLKIY